MMELLAPAGGMEQLHAAVRFGADAVYLAAHRFGMRARAANFALEELPAAVEYAHAAGVSVHVTCNILMHERDIADLPAFFRTLDDAGVDAFIISDMGAAAIAREVAPRVELHVSTQASVANSAAARAWHALGASRIVLAREMSLEDIARMREAIPDDLQLEAFVHGAMCMAVSGRCLISAYLTGRSGNKGHCTQPCRWNYTLEEEKRPGIHFPIEEDDAGSYIMNAKDLNMLAHLDKLAAAGVDSIKIEGRNKKAFYVATVVNAYRQVLDGADPARIAPDLEMISHRPYCTGFYFGPAEQADDYDGYEQTCLHVADVLACERCDAPRDAVPHAADAPCSFHLTVRCRNRFCEGDELEALVPRRGVMHVRVRNLAWFGEPDNTGTLPPLQAVARANRATDTGIYRLTSDKEIPAGSYLRIRQFRRSARSNEQAALHTDKSS